MSNPGQDMPVPQNEGTASNRPQTGLEHRATAETEFEKRRGISNVEIRRGYVRVHVSKLGEPVMESRLRVLDSLRKAGVSIDFLKFTQSGATFMAPEGATDAVRAALQGLGVTFSIKSDRCIVLVDAVNMRDEEGLIANIVAEAIGSGARIDHLGDMHDRLLMVTGAAAGKELAERIRERFIGGAQ